MCICHDIYGYPLAILFHNLIYYLLCSRWAEACLRAQLKGKGGWDDFNPNWVSAPQRELEFLEVLPSLWVVIIFLVLGDSDRLDLLLYYLST